MTGEITIPLLPCRSINDLLEFYRALGFEVTYQQAKPNNYAVVCRDGIELHFFSMREFNPATSYSSCYVRVSDVDQLYGAFTAGLRQTYGRLPSAGIPRVIPRRSCQPN
ncbi:MAG: VOC family protein [Roseiflexaceae bacterium]